MTLGEFILNARVDRGFTQAELGEKCRISGAEISRLEAGKRKNPSPIILRSLSKALIVDYAQLMQLAGYTEEVHEEEKTFEQVFRNADGEIVDVVRGVKEMFRKDATWANVAYRVSSELNDTDREILTELAMTYLEKRRKEIQAENDHK
ncbi:MAG: helix-turn-helix transcriptional regulator [Lachnospiraceae bacterium]|jgi:transcriptional regulator with XRE-family HTH domain|nr:helix-turn-helix transcriptional regulator [Lachnospiraceae bacterium]